MEVVLQWMRFISDDFCYNNTRQILIKHNRHMHVRIFEHKEFGSAEKHHKLL
jgi:hypothetical protein